MDNIQNIGLRITELVDYFAGGVNTRFAELIGTSEANIRNYKSGKMIPKYDFIYNVCSRFEINYEWFILGKGDMLKTDKQTPKPYKEVVLTTSLSEPPTEYGDKALKIQKLQTIMYDYQNPDVNIVSIPIVDVAGAAGSGFFNSDTPETLGELSFPANFLQKRYGNYYCGKVRGDSMEPTLLYGDFIVFRLLNSNEWAEMKSGDVYFIVNRSGESVVKRVENHFRDEGYIICRSDNPDIQYKGYNIPHTDIANIYHIEWRFSNNMTDINKTFFSRVDNIEDRLRNVEDLLKKMQ